MRAISIVIAAAVATGLISGTAHHGMLHKTAPAAAPEATEHLPANIAAQLPALRTLH